MSLRARLLGAVSYVLLLAIVAFGVPLGLSLSARVNAEVRTQAQAQADLVAAAAADLLGPASRRQLDTLIHSGASSLLDRVLIVNRSGHVVVDSAGPAEVGTSYLSRPEIGGALAGRQTQVQRASTTLGREILATAVPIIHGGRTVGAVRVTQSISAVHRAVLRVELAIALIALIVLALGLLAGPCWPPRSPARYAGSRPLHAALHRETFVPWPMSRARASSAPCRTRSTT